VEAAETNNASRGFYYFCYTLCATYLALSIFAVIKPNVLVTGSKFGPHVSILFEGLKKESRWALM